MQQVQYRRFGAQSVCHEPFDIEDLGTMRRATTHPVRHADTVSLSRHA